MYDVPSVDRKEQLADLSNAGLSFADQRNRENVAVD